MADASELTPGRNLDRYELMCPLARGGMAEVWVARLRGKRGFEKLVAIKTVLDEHAADARFQAMFLDEARLIARLKHPNIAEILDLGEEDNLLFLVLELVEGDSLSNLRRILERRGQKFPLNVALRIMSDACAGLHAAHELRDEQGRMLEVVHRDFSPSNVLVSTAGAVKLIDFGIAKALHRQVEETSSGIIKGKVSYMAPEQATGAAVDRRADVWAVGAVLHHLLSGAPPYRGENQLQILNQLVHGRAPAPLPGVPPDVAALVSRALERDPNRRFATAEELQRALEDALAKNCAPTTSVDVAKFVSGELAERLVEKKESVRRAIDEADAQSNTAVMSDSAGARLTGRRSRAPFLGLLALVAAVAVAVAFYGMRRSGATSQATSTASETATPEPSQPLSSTAAVVPQTAPTPAPSAETAPAISASAEQKAGPKVTSPKRISKTKATAAPKKKTGSDLFEVFNDRQ